MASCPPPEPPQTGQKRCHPENRNHDDVKQQNHDDDHEQEHNAPGTGNHVD